MSQAEDQNAPLGQTSEEVKKTGFVRHIRNKFLTGIVVSLPILVTILGISAIVGWFDEKVLGLVPARYKGIPWVDMVLSIPGLGLIVVFLGLIILGILASNIIGTSILKAGERILARVPVVSNVYNFMKQIVTTIAQQGERSFKEVCLIEYPRPGLWAVAFVTSDLQGAPKRQLGEGYVCVFVPTTPNPTSGFLLFVKREDMKVLDMTPEEGAKMIISGGMVTSNEEVIVAPKSARKKVGLD
ncbi:DUF502 domain-containing protein [Fretibacter rubidus]|uniref:DUF502 domain-containing protein n=1 Tax=Fretibacter rubidus TaxID=570162 RepID=UPI00352AEBD3